MAGAGGAVPESDAREERDERTREPTKKLEGQLGEKTTMWVMLTFVGVCFIIGIFSYLAKIGLPPFEPATVIAKCGFEEAEVVDGAYCNTLHTCPGTKTALAGNVAQPTVSFAMDPWGGNEVGFKTYFVNTTRRLPTGALHTCGAGGPASPAPPPMPSSRRRTVAPPPTPPSPPPPGSPTRPTRPVTPPPATPPDSRPAPPTRPTRPAADPPPPPPAASVGPVCQDIPSQCTGTAATNNGLCEERYLNMQCESSHSCTCRQNADASDCAAARGDCVPGTGRRSLQQGGDGGLPGALIGVVNSSSSWFAAEPNAPAGFTEGTAGYQMVGRSYDGMVFLEFDQVEFAPNIHINVSVDVFLAGDWTTGPEDVFRAWVEVNDAREITLLPDCADTIHGGNESAAFMAGRWMTISADLTAFTRARLMLGLQSSSAGSDKAVYIDNFKVVGGGTKNEIWCLANDEPLWAEETCETLQQEAAEEAAADAEKKGGKGMATTFLVLSIIGATGGIASVLFGWDPTGDDDDDDAPQVGSAAPGQPAPLSLRRPGAAPQTTANALAGDRIDFEDDVDETPI